MRNQNFYCYTHSLPLLQQVGLGQAERGHMGATFPACVLSTDDQSTPPVPINHQVVQREYPMERDRQTAFAGIRERGKVLGIDLPQVP